MSEVSIKIEIAGAEYPLKIKQEDVDILNKATSLIKNKIAEFDKNYTVTDKKDVLAMVLIQMVSEFMKEDEKKSDEITKLQALLDDLQQLVKQHQQKVS
ncbi:MAG TPA: cell division protein ZapA [Bacteroidia bacterium]